MFIIVKEKFININYIVMVEPGDNCTIIHLDSEAAGGTDYIGTNESILKVMNKIFLAKKKENRNEKTD